MLAKITDKKPIAVFPLVKKKIDTIFSRLSEEKVKPWIFLRTGKQFKMERCGSGKSINYSGVGFDGSPRQVFWNGFIEPCLEDAIERSIKEICDTLIVHSKDTVFILEEAERLLKEWVEKIYLEMAKIDNQLIENEISACVALVDCSDKIQAMNEKVVEHINANKHLLKPKKNFLKSFKFWLSVVATVVVPILGFIWKNYYSGAEKTSAQYKPINSPNITAGDGASFIFKYGDTKNETHDPDLVSSMQTLETPVGTRLSLDAVSKDTVAVTGMRQEGEKTIIEVEPIVRDEKDKSLLGDILVVRNEINDARAWKEKWASGQFAKFKAISSDFINRNMIRGPGFINALIDSVNSFTEEGQEQVTKITRKIESIMIKHGKQFSSSPDMAEHFKNYKSVIAEMQKVIQQMQEVPKAQCVQILNERCDDIVRSDKYKKFEPELLS